MNPNELLLPPAARLVHIGPHKTGTTSLQRAFHTGRDAVSHHGVHYTGRHEQPLLAALAVAGGRGMKGDREPRPEDWTELLDEVRDAGDQRVVISSEFLCYADEAAARRVVSEVPGGPVHLVVTLRPVAKIAPSQWQQYVQNGLKISYVKWLDGMFRRPPYDWPTPSFWRRHSHGELVRRWAEAAGRENLTVVVADESEPDMLLRTFEAMLGLPHGLLVPGRNDANRSLSRGEIELVRALNVHFSQHKWTEPWSEAVHGRVVRGGVVAQMKKGRRPAPDEPRLRMPDWAVQRSTEVGAETVETIKSLGVRVIGDLATLAEVPADRRGGDDDLHSPAVIAADAAAHAVFGAIKATGKLRDGAKTAAVLTVLAAINAAGGVGDSGDAGDVEGMPSLPVDAAAPAVLGIIEATGSRGEFAKFNRIPTEAAALATIAGARASGGAGADLGAARPVFAALGVRAKAEKPAAPKPKRSVPLEKRPVGKVGSRELVRVIARRGRRRFRRR
jgi:hypothetical protein